MNVWLWFFVCRAKKLRNGVSILFKPGRRKARKSKEIQDTHRKDSNLVCKSQTSHEGTLLWLATCLVTLLYKCSLILWRLYLVSFLSHCCLLFLSFVACLSNSKWWFGWCLATAGGTAAVAREGRNALHCNPSLMQNAALNCNARNCTAVQYVTKQCTVKQ